MSYLNKKSYTLHSWNETEKESHFSPLQRFGSKYKPDTLNYQKHQLLIEGFKVKILGFLREDIETGKQDLLKVIKVPSLLYRKGSRFKCLSQDGYGKNVLELNRVFQGVVEALRYDVMLDQVVSESHSMCVTNRLFETQAFQGNQTVLVHHKDIYILLSTLYCALQKQEKKLLKALESKVSKSVTSSKKSETQKQNKTLQKVSDYVRSIHGRSKVFSDPNQLYKINIIPKSSYFRYKDQIRVIINNERKIRLDKQKSYKNDYIQKQDNQKDDWGLERFGNKPIC